MILSSSFYFSFMGKENEAHAGCDLLRFTSITGGRAVIENSVDLNENEIRDGV